MSDIGIGRIITTEQHRDAIHVAVCPVVAQEFLTPGQHVGFDGTSANANPVGIVDPFLTVASVQPGQSFYLFLYPGSITSLRHEWTHPGLEKLIPRKSDAEIWLEQYAIELGMPLTELIEYATDWVETGDYIVQGGRFEGKSVPAAFWPEFVKYTGIEVPEKDRHNFFSCSC